MVTDQAFEQANARTQQRLTQGPVATHAEYDPSRNRLVISLSNGLELGIAPDLVEGLAGATPTTLAQIEISPSGLGLYFPELDADLYVPALLEGLLGARHGWPSGCGIWGQAKTASGADDRGRLVFLMFQHQEVTKPSVFMQYLAPTGTVTVPTDGTPLYKAIRANAE